MRRALDSAHDEIKSTCLETFEKEGYSPNEAMWQKWEKAWMMGKQEGFDLANGSHSCAPSTKANERAVDHLAVMVINCLAIGAMLWLILHDQGWWSLIFLLCLTITSKQSKEPKK